MFDVFYLGTKPPGLFAHERAVDSVEHARSMSRTRYLWIVDCHNDYSAFDWLWEPQPWQSNQAHVWPSQHQVNGGTWLIPRTGYLGINREHKLVVRNVISPRLHIRHCANSVDQGDITTRFVSDYLGTLRRALSKVTWTHCWVTTDVCDYTDFDLTWHPSEWQSEMLHVFASNEQRYGDTFYVHVPTFLEQSQNLARLDWFDTIHFVENIAAHRAPPPVVRYTTDSVVDAVWQHNFETPITEFYRYQSCPAQPTVNLWSKSTRAVIPLRQGSETVLIPRDVKNALHNQIYDYGVIDHLSKMSSSQPLDVVFISNGEPGAEYHYDVLQQCLTRHSAINAVHRSSNVQGRVACYQAAARTGHTDWFFAVFAKLEVNEDFDWAWQPDRLQQAKHYIFHAYNPVNHLVYGHQAMIAYNRRLVLGNPGQGLDFTLDDPHEVVPLLSGTARYDSDAWTCWRTAFREVIKLRHSLPDVENQYRLEQWLQHNDNDDHARWSHIGAEDAVKYYESVAGDFVELRKSYDWQWLSAHAMMVQPSLIIKT